MFPWTDGLPRSTSISRLGRCEVSQPAVSPAQAHTEPPGLPHPALHQHETAFPRVLLHGGRHLGPPAPASCWADHIPPPDGPRHHAPPQGLGCGWVPPGSQLTPGQHRSHGRRIWTCRDTGTGRATPRIRGGMGGTTDQGLQGAESEMGETPWGSQQRVGLPTRGHAGPSGHSTRAPVLRAARQAPLDLLHVFYQPVLCAPPPALSLLWSTFYTKHFWMTLNQKVMENSALSARCPWQPLQVTPRRLQQDWTGSITPGLMLWNRRGGRDRQIQASSARRLFQKGSRLQIPGASARK